MRTLGTADEVFALWKEASGKSIGLMLVSDYHHPMWAHLKDVFIELEETVYHIPLDQDLHALEWLRPMLESEDVAKIVHNAKSTEVLLMNQGISLRGIAGDTLLLAYVNDPSFIGDDLGAVLLKYLNLHIARERYDLLTMYLQKACQHIKEETPEELIRLLQDMEMPVSAILARMEYCGVKVEKSTLSALSAELGDGIKQAEQQIYHLADMISH